jgi:serine/threonine-protein kinase
MTTRNTIITAALTSVLTTIIVFFGLDYLRSRPWTDGQSTEVPLILGLTQAQAESVLRQQGLKLSILERRPSADFRAGTVSVQVPDKGKKVPKGSVVTAVMSSGQPRAKIPAVVGKPLTKATTLLTGAGFKLGPVKKQENPAPQNQVIASVPAPGAEHKKGGTVQLTVSAGPGLIEVPKVEGGYYGSAKKKIIEAGFVVGKISWRDSFDYDSYKVLDQDPEPGEKAAKGSAIKLTVNRGE